MDQENIVLNTLKVMKQRVEQDICHVESQIEYNDSWNPECLSTLPNDVIHLLYTSANIQETASLRTLLLQWKEVAKEIDTLLGIYCAHDYETDVIDLPSSGIMKTICYCRYCFLEKQN